MINVSGEKDLDKQAREYRKYFINASEYSISNYELFDIQNEILLDLEKELPVEYKNKWDVVFNHTVLEHIYDVRTAFANLCAMGRKAVVIVVPFVQGVHYKEGVYADYWRPTPLAIKKMFEENGFEMLYYTCNDMEYTNTYLLCVGVREEYAEEYRMLDNRPHNYHAGKWVQKYGSEWPSDARIKQKIKQFIKNCGIKR